ncbi:MAG: hypothetical protein M1495_00190 [Bacteroidetes bacterium]|nr:hypothetical protein [Bacteroidota bacterium]MCL6098293.1 hypothetical protein [Bacteroidota bacterium]
MTVASIDIGSNTVLLLIAKVSSVTFEILNSSTIYSVPRVSEGVREHLIINSTREALLFATLKEYQNVIEQNNCKIVLPVATNAFRIAQNAEQIINQIRTTFGWDTKIISGEKEAQLTFLGAASPFHDNSKKGVIDIGGGSTEIVSGNKDSIEYKNSFALGVVSLTEKFFKHNPPLIDEIDKAIAEIDVTIKPILDLPNPNDVIAVAGTPTTLACIKNSIRIYDDSLVDNAVLTDSEVKLMRVKLMTMTHEQIKEKYGDVVSGREDVLLAGTLILERIINAMRLNQITVSSKGLRYGIVYDYLMSINNSPGKK